MLNNSSHEFYEMCTKVSNKIYLENLMNKQKSLFDIQPYKIDKLYSENAKKLYNLCKFKYEVSRELTPNPNLWFENERKIFVWYVVCYFFENRIEHPNEVFFSLIQEHLNWTEVSRMFFGKNIFLLKFQFQNILKQKERVSWSPEEDNLLITATDSEGAGNWNEISKYIYFMSSSKIFKSPKHCRERWLNHLDQSKNKGRWTPQEDYSLLTFIQEHGKKWSRISHLLNRTRTEHMVKNRFNSLMSKEKRNKKEKETETITRLLKVLERELKISGFNELKLENRTTVIETYKEEEKLSTQKEEESPDENFEVSEYEGLEEKISIYQNALYEEKMKLKSEPKSSENFGIQHDFTYYPNQNFGQLGNCLFFYYYPMALRQEENFSFENGSEGMALKIGINSTLHFENDVKTSYKTKPVYIIQQNISLKEY